MKFQLSPFFIVLFALAFAPAITSVDAADTATIEAITGLKGVSNQTEGTFKISKPCLFAISLGLSDMHPGDDQAVLRDGSIVYDALYQWLKFCCGEKHLWFPPVLKPSTAT